AREIADHTSAVAVALARQLLWKMLGADHPMEAHRLESLGMHAMGQSPDGYEGVASFLEKRPARFTIRASKDLPAFFPWWPRRPCRRGAARPPRPATRGRCRPAPPRRRRARAARATRRAATSRAAPCRRAVRAARPTRRSRAGSAAPRRSP